jgi:hypothetical protein
MNLLLLKQISILSAVFGGMLGLLALIAPLTIWIILSAFVLPAIAVIVYLKQNDLIGILSTRDGAIFGSIIGAVSFVAGFVVFAPISVIISWLFKLLFKSIYTSGVLSLIPFDFGSIILLILCTILLAALSALFNGFVGLITAYVYELITGVKKEGNANNSIDFQIK